jgi:hypothetical protein
MSHTHLADVSAARGPQVKRYAGWLLTAALVAGSGACAAERPQAAASSSPAPSADSGKATVTFQFDHAGLPVPRYVLTVHEDGSGTYHAEESERRSADSAVQQVSMKQVDRAVVISPETTAKIFETARALNHFNVFCGTKAKNIADTGKKILTYTGGDGTGTCTYNYSDDKNIEMLTSIFYGIAYTMDVGRKLDFERRFDRLGLDAELLALENAVKSKDALELGNIAPTLKTIATDAEVMQRARVRAGKLLDETTNK